MVLMLAYILCMFATASNNANRPNYATLASKYSSIRITTDSSYQIEGVMNNIAEVGSPILLKASGIESQHTKVYFLPYNKYLSALQSNIKLNSIIEELDYTYTIRVVKFMAKYDMYADTGFNNVEFQDIYEPTLELLFVPDINPGKYILVTRHLDFVDIAKTDVLEWYSPSISSLVSGNENVSRYIVYIYAPGQSFDPDSQTQGMTLLQDKSMPNIVQTKSKLNDIWAIMMIILGVVAFLSGYAIRGINQKNVASNGSKNVHHD